MAKAERREVEQWKGRARRGRAMERHSEEM